MPNSKSRSRSSNTNPTKGILGIDSSGSLLNISIRSRSKVVFDGHVHSLTSINDKGEFDVLPMHANFVTLIKDYIILDKGWETERKLDIRTGLMNTLQDRIDVYLDLETGAEEAKARIAAR